MQLGFGAKYYFSSNSIYLVLHHTNIKDIEKFNDINKISTIKLHKLIKFDRNKIFILSIKCITEYLWIDLMSVDDLLHYIILGLFKCFFLENRKFMFNSIKKSLDSNFKKLV